MRALAALTVCAALAAEAPAQSLDADAAYRRAVQVRKDASDLAYSRCLAGQEMTRESSIDFAARIRSLISTLTGGLAFRDRQRVTRGAIDAPVSVRVSLDSAIRDCLVRITPIIEGELLADARRANPVGTAGNGFPATADLRFTYRRGASLDPNRYSEDLRVNLTEGDRVRPSINIASQSETDGSPYFFYTYVPFPSQRVVGTISAKPLGSRLTADQAPRARVCLERVPAPPPRPAQDMLACVEGGSCKPVGATRGWLRTCPGFAQSEHGPLYASLAQTGVSDAASDEAALRHWATPSVATLIEHPGEQVGWSYFKLRTDAFRRPGIGGVEVALAVNGVPVDEDGLAPADRLEPNDPTLPFDLLFALQTLNFEGRDGGCDTLRVSLTPLSANGARGTAVAVDLSYAALRDQPQRTERSPGGALAWSASVIRPIREWRHWAFVRSYPFSYGNAASQRAAVVAAEADKSWLDGRSWTYQGARVRGVIRPPLTVRNGKAAYGLTVGLVQPSGQVRFTFAEGDARAIGRWMIGRRTTTAEAMRLIAPAPYIYQAPSGGVTPAGICGPA